MPLPLLNGNSYLRILFNLRVCDATAWQNATQLVFDVDSSEAHIACSGTLESAQVIPCINQVGRIRRILGIDAD